MKTGSLIKGLIMRKLTLCLLATVFMLSVIPAQLIANTASSQTTAAARSDIKSTTPYQENDGLSLIKPLDNSSLAATGNKEVLKVTETEKNDQGKRGRKYHQRHNRRDVNLSIRSDQGYGHRHSGAYIGGGGVLLLILVLILVL